MGGGGGVPQGLAAIGAESGGAVDGDQAMRLLPLALQEQFLELSPRRPALADAKEGIDPDGWIPGLGGRFELGDPQPEGLAQVAFGEGFAPLKGAPDPHGDAGQVQLPGDHEAIAAVVAGAHQHERPMRLELCPAVRLLQPPADGQRGLLHQRLHGHAVGEEHLLELGHLRAAHQEVLGVAGGPTERGQNSTGGGSSMMERTATVGIGALLRCSRCI